MSVMLLEGFEHYSNAVEDEVNGLWTGVLVDSTWPFGGTSIVDGAWPGGKALQLNDGGVSLQKAPTDGSVNGGVITPVATIILGMRLKVASFLPTGESLANLRFLVSFGSDGITIGGVMLDENGQLVYVKNSAPEGVAGGNWVAQSTRALTLNAWHYVEVKVAFKSTAVGSVSFQIDGADAGTTGSIVTMASAVPPESTDLVKIRAAPAITTGAGFIDDFYMANTSGSLNNDFLGDIKVFEEPPDTDVVSDFTPATGVDNWAMVDEGIGDGLGPDEDDTYNESSTAGHIDRFSFVASGYTGTVKAVQLVARHRKTLAGNRNIRMTVVSGASTANGADIPSSLGYQYAYHVFETDPATGVAWATVAAAEAASAGYENRS